MPSNIPNQQPIGSQPQNVQQGQQTNPAAEQPRDLASTQSTLLLSEVRDDMAIMTDGTMRAVVACQSINFDLMSNEEREAVEFSYQNFLNSLDGPVQILVRSQRVDLGPYLDRLVKMRRDQDNMLLGVLMDAYIDFIDTISQSANIMDKSFFVVIPYYPMGSLSNPLDKSKGFFNGLFSKKQPITRIDSATFEKAKKELSNKVDTVISGLFQIGVNCARLDTKELGELYYNFYNPDTAIREPLGDFRNVTSTYIKKAGSNSGTPTNQFSGEAM